MRIIFLGSAKTGVLRKQNPGFCAARAAIERLLERFSRFRRPNPVISNETTELIFGCWNSANGEFLLWLARWFCRF